MKDYKRVNFTPPIDPRYNVQPFRFWCQKVMPLIYDDSLSYYELLCKVVDYLNKTIADVNTLAGDFTELHTAYTQLQEYVNNYFENLDVQDEINHKIDEMASNGELAELFGICPTVYSMLNTLFSEGRIVQTQGYYRVGDGGNNTYFTTKTPRNELSLKSTRKGLTLYFTPVEIFDITPFTETTRQTNERGTSQINILKYGCRKYPVSPNLDVDFDCSPILNTLLKYGLAIYIPNGEYLCKSPLYAKEINLTLEKSAKLSYVGDFTTYFIGINLYDEENKRFITHNSRINGGTINGNYNCKYCVCANYTQGFLIQNGTIEHFKNEGVYLGSIDLQTRQTYTIETKIDNETIRNYEQPENGWGELAGSYAIFSGGTDNLFSNLILMNTQRGVYCGSDDKFVNVHFWQQSPDLFENSRGFALPPNSVCSFTNCTIDNARVGFSLQTSCNITEVGTMFLYAPSILTPDFINSKGGFEYFIFAQAPESLVESCAFHSYGAQFSLATVDDVTPNIKLVPDPVYNKIMNNAYNFQNYARRYCFDSYLKTNGMINALPFGYDALHSLLNFDGQNHNYITENVDLNSNFDVGIFTASSGKLTNYPSDFPTGNVVLEVFGTPYIKTQTIKHNLFTAYRFGNVVDNVISWGNWRMTWKYPDYSTGSFTIKCPNNLNIYHSANVASAVDGTIPNGVVVEVTNWVTNGLYNFGRITYNDITGWVDLDYCIKN